MKKRILYFFFITFSTLVYSQSEPTYPINIQSPNASGLGKYGDIPMSLFTGVPEISIPLFDLDKRGVNLDISLSYDASGVRVQGHPSWVGQNWSLNAGGVITRTVQTLPDEYPLVTQNTANSYINKGGFFKTLGQDNFAYANLSYTPREAYITPNLPVDFSLNKCEINNYDCQPDIFTFNFMGMSGKFFMGNDGQWKVQSDKNFDIIFDINDNANFLLPEIGTNTITNNHNTIRGFTIRDDDGNTYRFGWDTKAIEYSIDYFYQRNVDGDPNQNYVPAEWIANAWYLTSVEDKYGKTIYRFEYLHDKFIAEFFPHYRYTNAIAENVYHSNKQDDLSSAAAQYGYWGGNLIYPVYLNVIYSYYGDFGSYHRDGYEIRFSSSESNERPYKNVEAKDYNGNSITNFPIGTVTDKIYERAAGLQDKYPYMEWWSYLSGYGHLYSQSELRWRKLDAISIEYIKNYQYNVVKTINFEYNNSISSETERLFLTKLNIGQEVYTMSYINREQLPDYTSTKFDHWGYYNGAFCAISNPQGREVNESYAKFGALEKLTYPTGGFSKFEYESNKYIKAIPIDRNGIVTYSNSKLAGGLRIKSITNFDGLTSTIKNYHYGDYSGTLNSGILYENSILTAIPIYNYSWTDEGNEIDPFMTTYWSFFIKSFTPLIPLSNSFGTHIEYPTVVEETCTPSNRSYTTYKFSNSNEIRDINAWEYTQGSVRPFSSNGYRRGKLKEKIVYDASGQFPVESFSYKYRGEDEIGSSLSVQASNFNVDFATPGLTISYYDRTDVHVLAPITPPYGVGGRYEIYYGSADLTQEIHRKYTDNQVALTTQKNYFKRTMDLRIMEGSVLKRTNYIKFMGSESLITNDNVQYTKQYYYPWDLAQEGFMSDLQNKFRLSPVMIESFKEESPSYTMSYLDQHRDEYLFLALSNNCTKTEFWTYKTENGLIVPNAWYKSFSRLTNRLNPSASIPLDNLKPEISFNNYDSEGNLLCYTDRAGIPTSIIWNKIHYKPSLIAKNLSLAQLNSTLTSSEIDQIENASSAADLTIPTTKLRNLGKNFNVTSYSYTISGNIETQTLPNSKGTKYFYDSENRLITLKTEVDKVLEMYEYHYMPIPYSE